MRRLPAHLTAYRIGDPAGRFPVYSADGALRVGGRWHERGDRVIYAAEHYSTAMLESLANLGPETPPNQHYIEITIPAGVSYEIASADHLPGWYRSAATSSKVFGHGWYAERRSAVLFVPSVVARLERNVVINATHDDFPRIKPGLETPVWWDERLFA
ncbi:MAG: RES domain-containing protein [Gammaproteobacteria bacterium]|nr:RES domain-containing protein [Gammaproteobacteria bacterium]